MSYIAPGVYIEEIPSGSRVIEGVPTSITALVGRALRGPADRPVGVTSMAEFERVFGPLWAESGLGYAVRAFFDNGGRSAVVVRVDDGSATARVDLGGGLVVEALGPGTWANDLVVGVAHPGPGEAAAVASAQGLPDGDSVFTLWLTSGDATEVFPHVTSVDGPRRVDTVLESSGLARVGPTVPAVRPAPGTYPVTSPGQDGAPPGSTAYLSAVGEKRGIRALDDVDLLNLLVLPPVTPAGQLPDDVWAPAMEYARERRAFLLVDPPPGSATSDVVAWVGGPAGLTGPAASHAAIYMPRIQQADPLHGGAIGAFASSGSVAGLYARTDATRGVWKAPAGTEATLVGTVGPSTILTDDENGSLNTEGVNAIRLFPGVGTVVWGSRTVRGADRFGDEYKYVPVRRLCLFIEESVARGVRWAVFEPNDEPLWRQLRLSVETFLHELFRQGAFQGRSARDAFFVTCDAETTSQADIAAGVVNVLVGVAPLKPAEFVVIRVRTTAAVPEP